MGYIFYVMHFIRILDTIVVIQLPVVTPKFYLTLTYI